MRYAILTTLSLLVAIMISVPKLPKNRLFQCGLVSFVVGVAIAILGIAAFNNFSETCYVNPGGFPCIDTYQVALLAPLYPLSGELLVLGILVAITGSFVAMLGFRASESIASLQSHEEDLSI